MSDKLCECDYCGVLRVYEPGKSCPGCGAPLTKSKRKEAPIPHAHPFWQGQQQMNQQMGMNQSNLYAQQMGMQQGMLGDQLSAMLGMGVTNMRDRRKIK